jgi:hypothetical protein
MVGRRAAGPIEIIAHVIVARRYHIGRGDEVTKFDHDLAVPSWLNLAGRNWLGLRSGVDMTGSPNQQERQNRKSDPHFTSFWQPCRPDSPISPR